MQCRSLRPLLADMQEAGLTYHWGFPFRLQVRKKGRQVTLHNKDDLPHFISTLELGNVDFPDWRGSLGLPTLALPQPWLPAFYVNVPLFLCQCAPPYMGLPPLHQCAYATPLVI